MPAAEIRPAGADDLAAGAAIYDHEVLHSTATFDTEPQGVRLWAPRLASGPALHLLVAVVDGAVVGYAFSSRYRPRPAYDRTREVSVYLATSARGRGLGRLLYDDLLARLVADGMHRAVAVIALPNEASEGRHAAVGFTRVGVLAEVGRKFDAWVDTAVWERALG